MRKFMIEYNDKLRGYKERLSEVYVELEGKGIVILSDLRIEMGSEVLSDLNMSKLEMDREIVRYIIKCLIEDEWE